MIQQAIIAYNKKHNKQLTPKAILFDMDGVLYDSMPYHEKSWITVAKKYGLQLTPEMVYMYEGRTGKSTINELFKNTFHREATPKELHDVYIEKTQVFNALNNRSEMKGCSDLLKTINEYNLQTLVVTGSGQKSLIEKLNHSYPQQFVREKMVTAFDVKKGKPNPEPYLMGLQKAGVEAHEAIVIENAPMGVTAGNKANIFTIAVNTGPLKDQILLDAGADLLFSDMISLREKWTELMDLCK